MHSAGRRTSEIRSHRFLESEALGLVLLTRETLSLPLLAAMLPSGMLLGGADDGGFPCCKHVTSVADLVQGAGECDRWESTEADEVVLKEQRERLGPVLRGQRLAKRAWGEGCSRLLGGARERIQRPLALTVHFTGGAGLGGEATCPRQGGTCALISPAPPGSVPKAIVIWETGKKKKRKKRILFSFRST